MLGPLRVERGGVPVPLGPRLVVLLSVLVMERGKAVPASRLVQLLWGASAPTAAATTLRSHVSHLRHAEVVAALPEVVAQEPYDENLRRLLASALYAEQRVDEAAEVCREGLTLLGKRGIDAPELQKLQRAILRRESTSDVAVPRMLPPDVPRFVGRVAEFAEARRWLDAPDDESATLVVTGPAGVGKTSFAVRLGHAANAQFPDGQVYVNLRGFDPHKPPMPPDEAVHRLLDALGVSPHRIPASTQAQLGLYRTKLAGRRMMVLLDNARDADQVLPLLPGSPSCRVVVTSRNQLPDLIAVTGAQPLTLPLLSTVEAQQLLVGRLGSARVADEPHAADDIITRCARLPLALTVVATRAAIHPDFRLDALAAELRDADAGLTAFAGGEAAVDVRAALATSYQILDTAPARMFRLLGLHNGPDIATPAAASLFGVPVGDARPLLAELARAHLITEHAPGRYSLHDLLRAYAIELAHTDDSDTERRAARHRLLDHYLHTAYTAARLLLPHRTPITVAPPQPGVTPEKPTDNAQAMAWYSAEHPVLTAAVACAAATGLDNHAWQLSWTLHTFFDRHGHWHDLAATYTIALACVRRLADRAAEARVHRGLGQAHTRLTRLDDAQVHFRHALDLFVGLGDEIGQASVHFSIAKVHEHQGRPLEALRHSELASTLFQTTGHRPEQARALNNTGWFHSLAGNHQQALTLCQ